jgi:alpha-tubulin suppressor-like RCC1 family protein
MAVATIAFNGHACAVTRVGDVYCWGPDEFLGNGTGPSASPLQVAGLHDAIDVAIATNSELGSGVATLVVLADGSVVGWGHAHGPGLTIDSNADQLTPIAMPGLRGVRQISLGSSHACALLEDAEVACWGSNIGGRLGSSSPNTLVPQVVSGLSDVAEVRAGESFTCARRTNGEVRCWGDNTFETLARPQPTPFSRVPVHIDVPSVTVMAVGQEHVCVLTSDGNVWCWGSNDAGQIAASDQVTFDTPVLVSP